jgi:hypothetical protein
MPKILIIAAAVGTAAVVNLILYGIGRAAGGTFRFTASGSPAVVDGITVVAFSVAPLLVGLVAVALLARFGGWVIRTALVVGPLLAIATIALMTLPADLDTTSTVTLALCHLVLVPVIIVAVRALGQRSGATRQSTAAAGTG